MICISVYITYFMLVPWTWSQIIYALPYPTIWIPYWFLKSIIFIKRLRRIIYCSYDNWDLFVGTQLQNHALQRPPSFMRKYYNSNQNKTLFTSSMIFYHLFWNLNLNTLLFFIIIGLRSHDNAGNFRKSSKLWHFYFRFFWVLGYNHRLLLHTGCCLGLGKSSISSVKTNIWHQIEK